MVYQTAYVVSPFSIVRDRLSSPSLSSDRGADEPSLGRARETGGRTQRAA